MTMCCCLFPLPPTSPDCCCRWMGSRPRISRARSSDGRVGYDFDDDMVPVLKQAFDMSLLDALPATKFLLGAIATHMRTDMVSLLAATAVFASTMMGPHATVQTPVGPPPFSLPTGPAVAATSLSVILVSPSVCVVLFLSLLLVVTSLLLAFPVVVMVLCVVFLACVCFAGFREDAPLAHVVGAC